MSYFDFYLDFQFNFYSYLYWTLELTVQFSKVLNSLTFLWMQMNLSADIEKIVKNITGTSETEETLSTVCREYCLHAQRAIVWSIAQVFMCERDSVYYLRNSIDGFNKITGKLSPSHVLIYRGGGHEYF